ncbi:SHQ1 protein-domain-containing protein [Paraphysoderma sedebokerense]|nr:SHQ1 protein-domain-containing protein [Paraphysoderma sedebokerense]
MITPKFSLSQDDDYVTAIIRCPYIKSQDVEFFIQDNVFKFYVKPYFLRLTFSHSLIEDGRESASYDIAKGEITAKLPKLNPGEEFEDLDLVSKLLMTKKESQKVEKLKNNVGVGIQVLGTDGDESLEGLEDSHSTHSQEDVDDDTESDEDWEFPQQLPQEELNLLVSTPRYGFNNAYTSVFASHQDELHEVLDVANPDSPSSNPQSRKQERLDRENDKFDPEYYLSDYINHEEIDYYINYNPWWTETYERLLKSLPQNTLSSSNSKLSRRQKKQELNEDGNEVIMVKREFLDVAGNDSAFLIRDPSESNPNSGDSFQPKSKLIEPLDEGSNTFQKRQPLIQEILSSDSVAKDQASCESPFQVSCSSVEELSKTLSGISLIENERMPLSSMKQSQPSTEKCPNVINNRPGNCGDEEYSVPIIYEYASKDIKFSEFEKSQMINLRSKELLLSKKEQKPLYLALIDLLYAYCYNYRTTEGENTVESGWTVAKLSACLSALDAPSTINDAVVTSYRRSLSYPLYRSFSLAEQLHKDVTFILLLGSKAILKALLSIYDILSKDELRWILNKVWVEDMVSWVSSWGKKEKKRCQIIAEELRMVTVQKSDLQLGLVELERLADEGELAEDNEEESDYGESEKKAKTKVLMILKMILKMKVKATAKVNRRN